MSNAIPPEFRPADDGFDIRPFHNLIARLRDPEHGCPWDRSRTLANMGKSLTEEAGEAAEALASDDSVHQCEELGDVFLNIMLAAVIAEEGGLFTWRDIVEEVTAKLVRRHPHVFGGEKAEDADTAMRMFLAAKAREKTRRNDEGEKTPPLPR